MLALFRRNRFCLASAFLLVFGSLHLLIADTEPRMDSPPYVNKRKVARIPVEILDQLAGHYVGTRSGDIDIQRDGDTLLFSTNNGKFDYVLYPESKSLFFLKTATLPLNL